jgi:phage/plasmid-like protein (TIGR03299 family)
MSHEVETMAFANEVPWHGLGNNIDATASVDDWLVAAGLNWNVDLRPMYAHLGNKMIRVPNKSALIRDRDNRVLTIASDAWKPIQNRAMLEFFNEYARAGGATLETAGSLRDGKLVWGLANLNHGFYTNNGADAVKGYVLFASPHEHGKVTSVRVTGTRVVCANTMQIAMGDRDMLYTQSHVHSFNFDNAREHIGLAHEGMLQLELNAKALEQLQMSEFDTVRLLAKYFQPDTEQTDDSINLLLSNRNERTIVRKNLSDVWRCLEDAPGATPGNGWGVLNAVTYWADHEASNSQDARLRSAWFGKNNVLKQDVEKDLLAMLA